MNLSSVFDPKKIFDRITNGFVFKKARNQLVRTVQVTYIDVVGKVLVIF